MTKLQYAMVGALSCFCLGIPGCGNPDVKNIKLVPVSGVITYNGSPLAGVRVIFFPDKGPMAGAETEMDGSFKLKTGAKNGCASGESKVAITIMSEQEGVSAPATTPKTPEEAMKMAQMTVEHQKMHGKKEKSLIPDKFKDPSTSGLAFTIGNSGEKDLKIELKD